MNQHRAAAIADCRAAVRQARIDRLGLAQVEAQEALKDAGTAARAAFVPRPRPEAVDPVREAAIKRARSAKAARDNNG
ncbi:hypothetical protein [Streptomyces sp. NPDC096033]|uniref:hypothetical protein n=1 Tax=Streptomyces sp. NPDC096033 TaxID=3366071 RepID=UPI00380E3138